MFSRLRKTPAATGELVRDRNLKGMSRDVKFVRELHQSLVHEGGVTGNISNTRLNSFLSRLCLDEGTQPSGRRLGVIKRTLAGLKILTVVGDGEYKVAPLVESKAADEVPESPRPQLRVVREDETPSLDEEASDAEILEVVTKLKERLRSNLTTIATIRQSRESLLKQLDENEARVTKLVAELDQEIIELLSFVFSRRIGDIQV